MFQPLPDAVTALFDPTGKEEGYAITADMITEALGGEDAELRMFILHKLTIDWMNFECLCYIFECDPKITTREQFKQLYEKHYNEPFPEKVKFDLSGYDDTYAAYTE